jgi:hypothetical protein
MMGDYSRLITSAEVYAVIMAKHRDQMRAFGSFSDPDGKFNGSPGLQGRMDTVWGIEGCDFPILEIQTTWDIDQSAPHKRVDQRHTYFLLMAEKDND